MTTVSDSISLEDVLRHLEIPCFTQESAQAYFDASLFKGSGRFFMGALHRLSCHMTRCFMIITVMVSGLFIPLLMATAFIFSMEIVEAMSLGLTIIIVVSSVLTGLSILVHRGMPEYYIGSLNFLKKGSMENLAYIRSVGLFTEQRDAILHTLSPDQMQDMEAIRRELPTVHFKVAWFFATKSLLLMVNDEALKQNTSQYCIGQAGSGPKEILQHTA